ncbi:MOSC domain-containing protein [Stutzerimonas azotifigens]|uniref:MOSC domain-containing protein n=1 Tax=Stutzerimonas azotifigens TaxID=291995 RepID=UPI00041F0D30|nr:MOSC domain-containing protein [Stutzerimonas azotifigens]
MSKVLSVSQSANHRFSKEVVEAIRLVEGEGVEGDAHRGRTVRHRSRVKRDPSAPNLRQVHLLHNELVEQLQAAGFRVGPGTMGENITTTGIDLLALPTGAVLAIGPQVRLEVTGLRNPCAQLDGYQPGLTAAVLDRDAHGNLVRKAGIMSVVRQGGTVRPGDAILVRYPDAPHRPLQPV